jgi:hypothetical protein
MAEKSENLERHCRRAIAPEAEIVGALKKKGFIDPGRA